MKNKFFLTLLALIGHSFIHAQDSSGAIAGKVTDANTETVMKGVKIILSGTSRESSSDERGRFSFDGVKAGEYSVIFSYLGYSAVTKTIEVEAGETSIIQIEMGTDLVELDDYVIQDFAVGQARALNRQRTASSLSNFVSADAVGRFPDQNVAESLQRLPGVSIEKDQGEGRFVSIRGIDPNLSNVSIDGVSLPSPESEARSVALDVIPNDVLETIRVTKVITPDMDADAIGGSIDIETKSAFDRGGRIFTGSLRGYYNDLIDKTSGKGEFTYGDLFGKNKDMAYIFSASYQERKMGSDNFEAEWDEDGGVYFPKEMEFRQYDVTRERYAFSGGLEFQPNDETYFYAKAIYNYFSDDEHRHRWVLVPEDGAVTAISNSNGSVLGSDKTTRDLKDRFEEQEIWTFSIGGETEVSEWKIDYGASIAHAEENEPDRLDTEFEYGTAHNYDYNFNLRDNRVPTISNASSEIYDPTNYEFSEAVVENNIAEDDQYAFQINASKDIELFGLESIFKTGLKYRDRKKTKDVRNDIYEDGTYTLANGAVNDPSFSFGKGSDGTYLRSDQGVMRDLFNAQLSDGTLSRDDDKSTFESIVADYESEEDVLSGYLMSTMFKDAWTAIIGARVEHTEFSANGFAIDEETLNQSSINKSKDYTDFLPAVVLRYDQSENLVYRASWTNSLARPNFEQSAYRMELNSEDDGEATLGNPELDPYQSMNLDASVEFYNENLGLFALSAFYKDIEDFIYTSVGGTYTDSFGTTYDELTTFLNGDKAELKGIEITWQQRLDKWSEPLAGFGFFITSTFSDSEAKIQTREIALPKHSDQVYTLGFSYENYGYFFRIAGTQRSKYLDSIGGEAIEDEYIDDNFQWDIFTSYEINDNFDIFAEFINIGDEPKYTYQGQSDLTRQYEEYSWAANAGVKWSF